MRWLTGAEVHKRSVRALGLDEAAIDLTSPEAKAALLRRTASYLCPCPPRVVLEHVLESLAGLIPIDQSPKDEVSEILEALIAYGDLFELPESSSAHQTKRGNLLFLRPPSFVIRPSGMTFLIGVAPYDILPILVSLRDQTECLNHVRRVHSQADLGLRAVLKQAGLLEIPEEHWLKLPRLQPAAAHLNRLNGTLDMAPPGGDVPGLHLLEPSLPVRYYKGRWQLVNNHSGRYVARRPQAYGADLWSFVELREGRVMKLVDLPLRPEYRGCDEAWRLQAAIDADRGNPQVFKIREAYNSTHKIVEFFSPLPMWARRRLDVVAEPLSLKGCLFAYEMPISELDQEVTFLKDALWMSMIN